MRTFDSVADLASIKGESIGESDWVTISQEDVNLFADATGDHQWIHVDPERAAKGPFGKTIAHGFMTLALLPRLQHQMYTVNGIKLAINYGLNKVRFPSPVPVGSRVRAKSSLVDIEDLGNGATPGDRVDHCRGRGQRQTGVCRRERRPLHRVGRAGSWTRGWLPGWTPDCTSTTSASTSSTGSRAVGRRCC